MKKINYGIFKKYYNTVELSTSSLKKKTTISKNHQHPHDSSSLGHLHTFIHFLSIFLTSEILGHCAFMITIIPCF